MQRIFNLSKWRELDDGKAVEFNNPKPRVVRLEVNAANDAAIYLLRDEGAQFLARVCGRDMLEFWTDGPFALCAQESGVYVYTPDGEDWSQRNLDDRVFTVLREKRQRSPEMEYMMSMMNRNMQRMMEQQREELSLLYERREALRARQREATSAPESRRKETVEVERSDDGDSSSSSGGEAPARRKGRSSADG